MNKHIRTLLKRWGAKPIAKFGEAPDADRLLSLRGVSHRLRIDNILVIEIQEMLSEGQTFGVVSWYASQRRKGKWVVSKCVFPKCKEPGLHGHHVVYEPAFIIPLCEAHHRDVTAININAASATRQKLTNAERWNLWSEWFKGNLKPIFNADTERWFANWRH